MLNGSILPAGGVASERSAPAGCASGLFYYFSLLVWSVLFWYGLLLLCSCLVWMARLDEPNIPDPNFFLQILILNYCTLACCRALKCLFSLFIISGHKIMLIPLNKIFWLVGIWFCSFKINKIN